MPLSETKRFNVSFAIAIAVNAVYWALWGTNVDVKQKLMNHFGSAVLLLYIAAILLFLFAFIVTYAVLKYLKVPTLKRDSFLGAMFSFIAMGLLMGWVFASVYKNELRLPPGKDELVSLLWWHTLPTWFVWAGLSLLFIGIFKHFVSPYANGTASKRGISFAIFSIGVCLFVAYIQYSPNVFTTFSGLLHLDAYYQSAYNAMYLTPISPGVMSIYGNYGIFFGLIMRLATSLGLVQNAMAVFSLLISVGTFVVGLCCCYTIWVFIKSPIIRYLTAPACLCINSWISRYWQIMPHRQVPLALVMAFVAFVVQHPKQAKKAAFFAPVLGGLLLVWSNDNGLVSAVALTAFFVVLSLQKYPLRSIQLWRNAGLGVCQLGASFVVALVVLNGYNLLAKGPILRLGALFTVASSSSFVEFLANDYNLPTITAAWMCMLALYYIFAAKGMAHTQLLSPGSVPNPVYAAYFSFAVLGLGGMVYYMNRPSWGHHEGHYMLAIVLTAIVADRGLASLRRTGLEKWNDLRTAIAKQGARLALGIASCFIVFCLGLGAFSSYSVTLRNSADHRDTHMQLELVAAVRNAVPPNTPGFGYGIPELYSILGWSTQFFTTDTADYTITEESTEQYLDAIRQMENLPVMTSRESVYRLPQKDFDDFMLAHRLEWEYTVVNPLQKNYEVLFFQYYVPVEPALST